MKKLIFATTTFIFIFITALQVNASTLSLTLTNAGELKDNVKSPNDVTSLSLTGKADAMDLKFIGTQMKNLTALDLSGVTIVECEGDIMGGVKRHPANSIPSNVFAGTKLQSVKLPVTPGLIIKAGAFAGAPLFEIDLPSTIAEIGDGCFAGCTELQRVVCGVDKIGTGVFSGCSALTSANFTTTVDIPADCFFNNTKLTDIKADDITSIGNRALSGCVALTTFPFGNHIKTIGREAFMQSGLETVDLSKCMALEEIGPWAFAKMSRLKTLRLGPATTVGEGVAFACPNLREMSTSSSSYIIPDFALSKSTNIDTIDMSANTIESIGKYALSGTTGIVSITLPASLENIDDHAMENMTNLKVITAPASTIASLGEDVWKGVNQGSVYLVVPEGMEDGYKNADQWQNFIITNSRPEIDSVEDAVVPTQIYARFEGDNLIIVSQNADIDLLSLYNPAGQLLTSIRPETDMVVVDTSGFATNIILVNAALADGRVATLKLSKH